MLLVTEATVLLLTISRVYDHYRGELHNGKVTIDNH